MVTTDLARALKLGAGVVLAMTAVGALLGLLAPGLAGSTQPHPTLTGSVSDALSIVTNNARVLAVPFALALLQLPSLRIGRTVGDVIIGALTAYSAVTVGIALGRWRVRLVPYLPHLPLEWAALSISVAAWGLVRDGHPHGRELLTLACSTTVLLCAAAAVETWATPHRNQTTCAGVTRSSGLRAGQLMRPRMVPAHAAGDFSIGSPVNSGLVLAPAIARCASTTDPQGGSST